MAIVKQQKINVYYPYDITIMRASLKGFALKFLSERRLRAMGKMEIEVIIRRAGEVILDILARL